MEDIHSIYLLLTTKLTIIHKILKMCSQDVYLLQTVKEKEIRTKLFKKIVSKISQLTSMVTLLTFYSALSLSLYARLQKLKPYYLDTGAQITVDVQLVLPLQHLLSWHHAL